MPLSTNVKLCVTTTSLGQHPSHTLEKKLHAAATHHFQGVEIVHKDLVAFAESRDVSIFTAASLVRTIAASHDLTILSLNPFKNFQGSLTEPLAQRLERARDWIAIARSLGTSTIQMPSQMDPASTGDDDVVVAELRQRADLGRDGEDLISFAYEAVAMAAHNSRWEDSLRIVNAVDRANFRICLDNFHIHAHPWGDPMVEGGKIQGGATATQNSLDTLVKTCPKDKVFYVQFSGARLFQPPLQYTDPLFDGLELKNKHLAWSRGARPFPLDSGDYLPVAEVARTWLIDWAWDGWVSFEGLLEETKREDCDPLDMARRARESWDKLQRLIEQ